MPVASASSGDVTPAARSTPASSPEQRPSDVAPHHRLSAFGPAVERGFQHHHDGTNSGVSSPMPGFSSRDDLPAPGVSGGEESSPPADLGDDTFGIIGGRGGSFGNHNHNTTNSNHTNNNQRGGGGGVHHPHHHHFHYRNASNAPTGYGRGSPHNNGTATFPNRGGGGSLSQGGGVAFANNVGRAAQQNAQEAAAMVLGGGGGSGGGGLHNMIDSVRKQVEYYFSVENLTKDTYLLTKMNPRMMVPLSEILSFPKIQQKNVSYEAVLAAVKLSKGLVVEVVREGEDIKDEGRPVLQGGVPHEDEKEGSWWIGPYPFSLPSSGCTLEFERVPENATVGDIEELTPEYPLLHSYNFANGSWNATYMDAASAYSALHCMLALAPSNNNKGGAHSIRGSTRLCSKVISVSIKGGDRLVNEMNNGSKSSSGTVGGGHRANSGATTTSSKQPATSLGGRGRGGHSGSSSNGNTNNTAFMAPVVIPPVPASNYNPNYPPGFMADMPSITVGKVPVQQQQRVPRSGTNTAASSPISTKSSPVAPGGRYTNSPYNASQATTPASALMAASTTSSVSVAAKSTTIDWADLDDDDSEGDADNAAAAVTAAKPTSAAAIPLDSSAPAASSTKKGGAASMLIPIGEDPEDSNASMTESSSMSGEATTGGAPVDAMTQAQKEHFHNVTAVAWEQQTRLAASMLRQRRAFEVVDQAPHQESGKGGKGKRHNNTSSSKHNSNSTTESTKNPKAGFGGSTFGGPTAAAAKDGNGGATSSSSSSALVDGAVADSGEGIPSKKEGVAGGYSLKGYNLTRAVFPSSTGANGGPHRGGGSSNSGGAPTPFVLSNNNNSGRTPGMMEMMEMMQSMMFNLQQQQQQGYGGGEEGSGASRSWGRHGRPNAKASPFTGTQRVNFDDDEEKAIREDTITSTTTTSTTSAAAVVTSSSPPSNNEETTRVMSKKKKGPTVLAALGADIDVEETSQRIAAAAAAGGCAAGGKGIGKKPSFEQSTEGGHSDSATSVTPSDEAPANAAPSATSAPPAVVRSGWAAIAAAPVVKKPVAAAPTEESTSKKGDGRRGGGGGRRGEEKKDGVKRGERSERKPRNGGEEKATLGGRGGKAPHGSTTPSSTPTDEASVEVHSPPASPVAAITTEEEPKAAAAPPLSSFLAAVLRA